MREVSVARVGGVELFVTPAAVLGFLLLWVALTVFGVSVLGRPIGWALVAGLAAAALHFVAALIHHLSHAVAARRTGHPMQAVRFGRMLVLATSVYPENEPELPARTHIRRALGGPTGSLLFALAAGAAAVALRPLGGLAYWLALFAALDSFLVFFVGVLLPLGFTDMSTILLWWGKGD